MEVFAIVGESRQIIDESGGDCPDGWIVMQGQRPEYNSIALEGGDWSAGGLIKTYKHFTGTEKLDLLFTEQEQRDIYLAAYVCQGTWTC